MLIAIGPADVDACLKKLRAAGFEDAVTIGHIVEKADYEFRVI
jgi:hydrogenase maturation factor